MKKAAKIIGIILSVIFILGSIYMIPSFFIDEWKDIFLVEAYKILTIIYFGFLALLVVYFLLVYFGFESAKLKRMNAAEIKLDYHHELEMQRNAILKLEETKPTVKKEIKTKETVKLKSKKPEPKKEVKVVAKPKKQVKTFDFIFLGHTYKIKEGWKELFEVESRKNYFKELITLLEKEYKNSKVYPNKEDIFKAFELCDLSEVKVVIAGKIPWYRKDQADGLAYSTKKGVDSHFTTKVVLEEYVNDLKYASPKDGSLEKWAKQGVLLLNLGLTCTAAKPLSHLALWEKFTNEVMKIVSEYKSHKVYVLWGEYVAKLETLVSKTKDLVIKAPNPSPLSAEQGFYKSKPFTRINKYLISKKIDPIDWKLS